MLVTKVKRCRTTELPPRRRSYKDDPSALLQYETFFWDNTVIEKSSFNHDRLLNRGSNHFRELVWERNTRN